MKEKILELKRQFIHALGILIIFVLIFFGKWIATFLCALIVIISIFSTKEFYKSLKQFHRPKEKAFTGVITFYAGCFIAIMIFPQTAAIAGISVLAIGDSISTLIGKFYGKNKLSLNKKKTLEGSLGFLASSFIILLFFTNILQSLFIAIIASIVEMLPIDDNLTIPIVIGLLISLI